MQMSNKYKFWSLRLGISIVFNFPTGNSLNLEMTGTELPVGNSPNLGVTKPWGDRSRGYIPDGLALSNLSSLHLLVPYTVLR